MNILSLGEKIKKLRKDKNMTLKELAGDRITAAQISHIERDKSHTSYELLDYLAERLEVSVDYLLETKEMQARKITDNLILQSEVLIKCNDLEEAENKISEALRICKEYKLIDNYGKCNFLLGDINTNHNNSNKAISNYEKALYFFIKNSDKENIFKCYLNIGEIYLAEDFYKGAILQFELAYENLLQINSEDIEIYKDIYSKIAYCSIKLNDYTKTKEFIEKIDEIDKKGDYKEEIELLMLKADSFLNEGEFEKSKEYFKRALELLEKEGNKDKQANIYLRICEIHKEMGEIDKVLEYSKKVYDIKKNDEDDYTMDSLFKIIEVNILKKEYEIAKKYCKIALATAIKRKNKLYEYKVLRYYSDIYKNRNDARIAIDYLSKCIEVIKQIDDKKILGDLYINLGELYSRTSKEKELEFYQKGVSIYRHLEIV